jgi:hypothetical protein
LEFFLLFFFTTALAHELFERGTGVCLDLGYAKNCGYVHDETQTSAYNVYACRARWSGDAACEWNIKEEKCLSGAKCSLKIPPVEATKNMVGHCSGRLEAKCSLTTGSTYMEKRLLCAQKTFAGKTCVLNSRDVCDTDAQCIIDPKNMEPHGLWPITREYAALRDDLTLLKQISEKLNAKDYFGVAGQCFADVYMGIKKEGMFYGIFARQVLNRLIGNSNAMSGPACSDEGWCQNGKNMELCIRSCNCLSRRVKTVKTDKKVIQDIINEYELTKNNQNN